MQGMPLMREHERLCEEDRTSRRTISDALNVLCECTGFDEHNRAEIRVGPMQLPSGELVGLVDIVFDAPRQEKASIVSLPTSGRFRCIDEASSARQSFEIARLDGAAVDAKANVLLADGSNLRAVEVIPARLPYEPSELDWLILHHVIAMTGAGEHCYRSLREGLPPHLAEMVPDIRAIDFARLYARPMNLPPLGKIVRYIGRRDPRLKASRRKIADALRTFGLRVPRPRPRARHCHLVSSI
jgi:hypothetical protein